jgi:hypothetical protein
MNSIDTTDKNAKVQFDDAIARLDAAQSRIRALYDNPLADETARAVAWEAYEQARLLWLSCEAMLRSAAIIDREARRKNRRVVVVHGNTHIAESLMLLLRLRGFGATALARRPVGDRAGGTAPAAIIVDIERAADREWLFPLDALKTAASTRVIALIPAALRHHAWDGLDEVLVKPASIDAVVCAIGRNTGP